MADLIRPIAELVNSSNAFEKIGAMLAIEEVRKPLNPQLNSEFCNLFSQR
jgi:hypothetical protein